MKEEITTYGAYQFRTEKVQPNYSRVRVFKDDDRHISFCIDRESGAIAHITMASGLFGFKFGRLLLEYLADHAFNYVTYERDPSGKQQVYDLYALLG